MLSRFCSFSCCLPALFRSLHVVFTCISRAAHLCRLCRFALAITCLPVETSRLVQRLECGTHYRVGNPRVEAGRSFYSLKYGMVLIFTLCWLLSAQVRYELRQRPISSFFFSTTDHPVVPRQSLDNRREWLVDPGDSAAMALHSVWQGQHSKSQGLCAVQCAEGLGIERHTFPTHD